MAERHVLAALSAGSDQTAYAAARLIAQGWHGGTDHHITALSHGRPWTTDGLVEEIDQLISRNMPQATPDEKIAADVELREFRKWASGTWTNSYRSTHGHAFYRDHAGEEVCTVCNGRWEIEHSDPHYIREGRYRASNGDDPTPCPGREVFHGDNHESGHELDCPEGCDACTGITCNDLLCTG